jgi:hypothetical protein
MPYETQLVMLFDKLEYFLENVDNLNSIRGSDTKDPKRVPEFKKKIREIKEAYKYALPLYKEQVERNQVRIKEMGDEEHKRGQHANEQGHIEP